MSWAARIRRRFDRRRRSARPRPWSRLTDAAGYESRVARLEPLEDRRLLAAVPVSLVGDFNPITESSVTTVSVQVGNTLFLPQAVLAPRRFGRRTVVRSAQRKCAIFRPIRW